jgi:cell division GTPase FtsZ
MLVCGINENIFMKKLKIVVVGIGRAGYATVDLLRQEKISSEIQTIKFNKDTDSIRIVTVEELECAHLVEFKSSQGSGANLVGKAGVRLMRGEKIVKTMLTGMNSNY